MSKQKKQKAVKDFDFIYNPKSKSEEFDDIGCIVDILERNDVSLDHFDSRMVKHLINFILHTAKRWDAQIVEDLLHRDEQDGVD